MNKMKNNELSKSEIEKINAGFIPSGGESLVETIPDFTKKVCEQGLIKHRTVISNDGSKLSVGTKCGGTIKRKEKWYGSTVFECSRCGGWHYCFFQNEIKTLEEFDLDPASKAILDERKN